jgi:hypothetical protein
MYKVGDIIKVKQNTYKLSKETISKLKEEYGHCLSERQLMEIREEQDDPFQKEDLVLIKEYDDKLTNMTLKLEELYNQIERMKCCNNCKYLGENNWCCNQTNISIECGIEYKLWEMR